MTGRKVAVGSLVLVAKRWLVRLLSLISTMVLARLLVPAEFGLLALALSFSMLFEVLAEFNFDLAIIRKDTVDDSHYHTAWTLNALGTFVIASALALAAPFFADFANAPTASQVLQIVALCFILDGLHNTGMVAWRRQLIFSKELQLEFWRKIIEVCVAIGWALVDPSVWALVAGMLVGRIAGVLLSYWLHPFRPRPSLQHWRELMSFSGWAMAFNFTVKLAQRTDHFLISRFAGLTQVGYYSNAQVLAALPTVELVMPISRALFPGFSAMLGEPERLRDAYLQALAGLLALALPLAVGLAFVAEAAVVLLLGSQWLPVTELVVALSLVQVVMLSAASSVPLLMALGKMRGVFLRALIMLICRPLLMYIGLQQMGLNGAPVALLVAISLQVGLDSWLIRQALHFSLLTWLLRTWRPYVAAAGMAAVLWLWLPKAPIASASDALVHLLTAGALGAPVYLLLLAGSWWLTGRPAGLEQMVWTELQQRLKRWRASA